MLPVSQTHYNMVIGLRGLKRYFSKQVLKLIAPDLLRDAKIGKLLNTKMYANYINQQMEDVRPTHPIQKKKPAESPDGNDTDDKDGAEKNPPKESS